MGRPYGRHDLKLLESNNPNALSGPVSCYPPQKVISPLGSSALSTASDLYDVYERKQDGIHDVVLDELRSQGLVGDDGRGGRSAVVKSFGLVRMGFVHQQKHPTVLLVVVKKGSFSASNAGPGQELKPDARSALTVLHKLERRVALVFAKEENEEQEETNTGDNEKRMFIDICETVPVYNPQSVKDGSETQEGDYLRTYNGLLPPINASIGIKNHYETGALCCYFKREGSQDLYALTNGHIVLGARKSYSPYAYRDCEEKYVVQSPSMMDHNVTISHLKREIHWRQRKLERATAARNGVLSAASEDMSEHERAIHSAVIETEQAKVVAIQAGLEKAEATLLEAESHDCVLGYVLAASGLERQASGDSKTQVPQSDGLDCPIGNSRGSSGTLDDETPKKREFADGGREAMDEYPPRKDWAVILVTRANSQQAFNSHRHVIDVQKGLNIDNFSSFGKNGLDMEWFFDETDYFNTPNPQCITSTVAGFEDEYPFIKPTSARTHFRIGQYNQTRWTLVDGECGITREHTITEMPDLGGMVLEVRQFIYPGDSGSAVLDKHNRLLAMAWGGELPGSGDILGPVDIKYVSLIEDVFRSCEVQMGWAQGSISLA